MTANVVQLRPGDDPDGVLSAAIGNLKDVLIIGYDHNGDAYAAGSGYFADGGNILWAIEAFKAKLLSGDFME